MKSYEKLRDAVNLIFTGINISQEQLEVIQKLHGLDEIKDIEVRLSNFSGMHKLREKAWNRTIFDVYCAVDDEGLLDPLVNPPKGRGIVNFLKKYKFDNYIYRTHFSDIDGSSIDLCLGAIPNPETPYDDVHYHIHLELLKRKKFDYLFKEIREQRANSQIINLCRKNNPNP